MLVNRCENMNNDDEQTKKREIFEAMSPRRQQRILQKGYDTWNPFLPPKEPSRFYGTVTPGRERETGEGTRLLHEFFESQQGHAAGKEYFLGAREICLGLHRGEERYRGMYAFCCWIAARSGREEK